MLETHKQMLRQYAQEFITGARVELAGPDAGHTLLWALETLEAWEVHLQALQPDLNGLRDHIDALKDDVDELTGLMEYQRATIEHLVVENDALRAKLYVQDRQSRQEVRDV
jgi:hypothetical protein